MASSGELAIIWSESTGLSGRAAAPPQGTPIDEAHAWGMQVLSDPTPLRLSKIIPAGTPSVLLCDQYARTLRYPVEVNDQLVAALVDTGASISFIRRSLVEEMQLPVRSRQPLAIGFANEQAAVTCQEVRV